MECPNCKKMLADNAKSCPECGYDFTEKPTIKKLSKEDLKALIGGWVFIGIVFAFLIGGCVNSTVDEVEADKAKNQITQEDIQQAHNFIVSLEAAGLIKEVKNQCADGTQGCYRLIIDEYLWNNAANYETKEKLIIASDIYFNSQNPYRFFEGIGYNSGKKLFDIWGIKN